MAQALRTWSSDGLDSINSWTQILKVFSKLKKYRTFTLKLEQNLWSITKLWSFSKKASREHTSPAWRVELLKLDCCVRGAQCCHCWAAEGFHDTLHPTGGNHCMQERMQVATGLEWRRFAWIPSADTHTPPLSKKLLNPSTLGSVAFLNLLINTDHFTWS